MVVPFFVENRNGYISLNLMSKELVMNIQAKKLELVDLILKTEKPALLELISQILKQEKEEDWWDELPDSVQESIDIALEQADRGKTIPNEVVLQETKAKYGLK